jgi:short subunit dehydrogenase-like uncharacterized protein
MDCCEVGGDAADFSISPTAQSLTPSFTKWSMSPTAQRRHADAQAAGIVICPGVGFDVIPADCLAAVLKQALPDATHLVLAFDARTRGSRGTARTIAESFLRGSRGGRVRRNGVIEEVPLPHSRRRVDFTGGSAMTVAIAWGDLATAYISTGVPNIETHVSMPPAAVIASALNWARPLLAWAPVQKLLRRLADRSTGPSEEELRTGRSRFWSKVSNAAGDHRTARLETANGYRPDRRRHDQGGEVPARSCTGRRLLYHFHIRVTWLCRGMR